LSRSQGICAAYVGANLPSTLALGNSDGASSQTTFELIVNNVAPDVAADNATVTVDEGDPAANTGSFSDPGADIVTISASIGTVSQVGTQNGTWNWSYDSTDGPDNSATVTITATDSDGAVNTTTFDLTVVNVAPTVAVDNDPVTVNEGETAENGITVSDPGGDDVTLTASVGQVGEGARLGGGLEFDGVNDYVVTDTIPIGGLSTLTIESWVKLEGTQRVELFRQTNGSGGRSDIVFYMTNTALTGLVWNNSNRGRVTADITGIVTLGQWAHVAMVFDGSEGNQVDRIRLYVDGLEIPGTLRIDRGSMPTVTWNQGNAPGYIGSQQGYGAFFKGQLDDLRLWNVARTGAEIQADMARELSGSETGLVAYYPLNDGTGSTTAVDATGDGHDGTLTNMDPATAWITPAWSFDTTDGPIESQPVTITATDSDGASADATFDLFVNNVAPDFEAGTNETLDPPQAGVFSRLAIPFTDPGADDHTVTIDWDGDTVVDETINLPLGQRTFDLSHTYTVQDTFTVTVTVDDNDPGGAYSDSFDVTVILNQPPVVNDQSFTIDENSDVGTVVGTAAASDPDLPGDTLIWSITAGNTNGAFAIDGAGGEISVANKAALDFETTPTFNVTVQVEDSYGETDDAVVTIDLNDLQASLSIDDASVVEGNSGPATLDFTVSVTGDAVNVPFSVNYNTADGTAVAAPNGAGSDDYEAAAGTLNFDGTAGQTQPINVTVNGDTVVESDETLTVDLTGLAGTNDVTLSGFVTIVDDDFVGNAPGVPPGWSIGLENQTTSEAFVTDVDSGGTNVSIQRIVGDLAIVNDNTFDPSQGDLTMNISIDSYDSYKGDFHIRGDNITSIEPRFQIRVDADNSAIYAQGILSTSNSMYTVGSLPSYSGGPLNISVTLTDAGFSVTTDVDSLSSGLIPWGTAFSNGFTKTTLSSDGCRNSIRRDYAAFA